MSIQQVPSPFSGWSLYFKGTSLVKGFIYDQIPQYLYVMFLNGSYSRYLGVPFAVVQGFTYATQPDAYYNKVIIGTYKVG